MSQPRFSHIRGMDYERSSSLYVANCGPAVGIPFDHIAFVFSGFGEVTSIHAADGSGARVIVCFSDETSAQRAFEALNAHPCEDLDGRTLYMRYSVLQIPSKVQDCNQQSVSLSSADLEIPGIYLVPDFISETEEQGLLGAVDGLPWRSLAKRRVQHYGYEFLYETRSVNSKQFLGELPAFVSSVVEKILHFPCKDICKEVDQLTVNEYRPGVGLSPHIDTHSAFDESIFSLSLAGPCVMEFRKYRQGTWCSPVTHVAGDEFHCSNYIRKALYLPPRSMLLMSGEGRYAWHHYIPHHKSDIVGVRTIRRSSRRVSFTFRKVKVRPCCCEYPQYCDSQRSLLQEES